MKKIVSFDKEILFPTMIGEITAISLDHTLSFLSKNDVEGEFIIHGRYKMTEASTIEEDFTYKLPVEIALSETFDLDTAKIDIDDFSYEILDEEILKVKIDVLIEGVEEVILTTEEKEEDTPEVLKEVEIIPEKIDSEENESKEKENVTESVVEEIEEEENVTESAIEEIEEEEKSVMKEEEKSNIQSIFRVFNDAEETYKAYTVYIMRKNDSLASVLDRYNISKEQLAEYNDLSQIELGSKIIIPTTNVINHD